MDMLLLFLIPVCYSSIVPDGTDISKSMAGIGWFNRVSIVSPITMPSGATQGPMNRAAIAHGMINA
jgi:hypothetical protein